MSFVAVAIGGSAIVGAVAASSAAGKAAKAQKNATAANIALQQDQDAEARRQYDTNRADLAPYRDAGYTALGQLGRGTVDGGEFNRDFTLADFQADPGYEFARSEGQRGIETSASARGGVLSGGTLKAIMKYGTGAASTEFGNAYNRYQNNMTTRYNRLAGLAGTGQTATNDGIAAGNRLTDSLQTGVNNTTSNNNAAANATASQYAATGNAIGSAANSVGQYVALKSFMGNGGGGVGNFTYNIGD